MTDGSAVFPYGDEALIGPYGAECAGFSLLDGLELVQGGGQFGGPR